MFDKILLGLLILLLPVSMLLTRYYLLKNPDQPSQETLKKVDTVLAQLQNNIGNTGQTSTEPEITLTTVFYASESGILKVAGVAPKGNLQLWIGATTKEKASPKVASESAEKDIAVLGESVTLVAVPVGLDGVFTFDYPIDDAKNESMELRLEQGKSKKTIVYYLEKKTFEEF